MVPRVFGQAGAPLLFKGAAYDFGRSIAAIEFSLDQGANWTRHETPGTNNYQNVSWEFEWTPQKPGFYVLHIRSVNELGKASPEAAHVEIQIGESARNVMEETSEGWLS